VLVADEVLVSTGMTYNLHRSEARSEIGRDDTAVACRRIGNDKAELNLFIRDVEGEPSARHTGLRSMCPAV
jgi:hypothetical protein